MLFFLKYVLSAGRRTLAAGTVFVIACAMFVLLVGAALEPDWQESAAVATRSAHEVAVSSRRSENRADFRLASGREVRDVKAPSDVRKGDVVTVWTAGSRVRTTEPGWGDHVPGAGAVAIVAGVLVLGVFALDDYIVEAINDKLWERQNA